MPSMDSHSSCYSSSSGSSTSSLSSPRVPITDIIAQQQQQPTPPKQLPIRIHKPEYAFARMCNEIQNRIMSPLY